MVQENETEPLLANFTVVEYHKNGNSHQNGESICISNGYSYQNGHGPQNDHGLPNGHGLQKGHGPQNDHGLSNGHGLPNGHGLSKGYVFPPNGYGLQNGYGKQNGFSKPNGYGTQNGYGKHIVNGLENGYGKQNGHKDIYDYENELQTTRRPRLTSAVDDGEKHGSLSIPTTCLFLVSIMASSGTLALPKSVDNTGIAGIVMIALFCLPSIYTANILGRCWTIMLDRGLLPPSGHVRYPYPAIGEAAFGMKGLHMVSFAINITNFGTVVVYILLASENVHGLIQNFVDVPMCYICPMVAGIVLPITWLGTPKDFWGTAVCASLCTLVASFLVFGNMIHDAGKIETVEHAELNVVTFFTSIGILAFAYGGHPVFPTVQADMTEPRHFGRATFFGYLALLVIYLPAPIASYFVYGDKVRANVLNTLPMGAVRTTATILMTLQLFQGIVIISNPVSQEVEQLLKIDAHRFTWKRAVNRTVVLGLALFLAESVPHFSPILALIGGSTVTLLGYVYPSLFFLKIASQSHLDEKWEKIHVSLFTKIINIVVILLGITVGIAATYSAVHELVNSSFSKPCYMNPYVAEL